MRLRPVVGARCEARPANYGAGCAQPAQPQRRIPGGSLCGRARGATWRRQLLSRRRQPQALPRRRPPSARFRGVRVESQTVVWIGRLDGPPLRGVGTMTIHHGGNVFAISRERGWDWRSVRDFSASINPLGAAPRVKDAIVDAIERIRCYPEAESSLLRAALAQLWHVDERLVLPGNGATELLHFFARWQYEETVTLALPTFSEYFRAYPNARYVDADDPDQWP